MGAPLAPGLALTCHPCSPVSAQNCFELYIPNNKGQLIKACKTEADGRVVEGNHMVYRISAPTQEEKDEWIKSIQAAVSVDPFYEMLAARKKRISVKKKQEQP